MSKGKKAVLGLIFILILIYLFSRQARSVGVGTLQLALRFGQSVSDPLWAAARFGLDLPNLSRENQRLRQENLNLAQFGSENRRLRDENQALKNQLSVLGTPEQSLVAVEVLGEIFRQGEPLLVLGQGSQQGLAAGLVVVKDNHLVGEILQVSPWMSLVRPIYSAKIRVPAQLTNFRGEAVLGVVQGDAKRVGEVLLAEVQIDDYLETGDLVETSGALGRYPPHLVVGRVRQVERVENQTHQQATIELLWHPQDLGVVFVYLGKL